MNLLTPINYGPAPGIVLYRGDIDIGGKVVVMLGPKWRIHSFAHLQRIDAHIGDVLGRGERLGTVGDSGNAAGKATHLHYAQLTPLPYPWRIDDSRQVWKKVFT